MKQYEQRQADALATKAKVPLSAAQRAVRRFNDSHRWYLPVAITALVLLVVNFAAFWLDTRGTLKIGGVPKRVNPALHLILFLAIAVLSLFRHFRLKSLLRQEQKAPSDICLSCGYDLRGTPGDRCPECGEARDYSAPKAAK